MYFLLNKSNIAVADAMYVPPEEYADVADLCKLEKTITPPVKVPHLSLFELESVLHKQHNGRGRARRYDTKVKFPLDKGISQTPASNILEMSRGSTRERFLWWPTGKTRPKGDTLPLVAGMPSASQSNGTGDKQPEGDMLLLDAGTSSANMGNCDRDERPKKLTAKRALEAEV